MTIKELYILIEKPHKDKKTKCAKNIQRTVKARKKLTTLCLSLWGRQMKSQIFGRNLKRIFGMDKTGDFILKTA